MRMNGYYDEAMRWLWTILASIAGAVTALSFRPFKKLSAIEIGMSLFVGASFAMFVSPWVIQLAFGSNPVDVRIMGAIFYMMASGSNILIPFLIQKIGANFGFKDEGPKP